MRLSSAQFDLVMKSEQELIRMPYLYSSTLSTDEKLLRFKKMKKKTVRFEFLRQTFECRTTEKKES